MIYEGFAGIFEEFLHIVDKVEGIVGSRNVAA
jgi:hypothetical protein